ncbi:MAG: nucleotide-diphospho-sugar transferase [Flavobacteriaceae bacterium]|nr:nucleotide-diphospho-sugar transferase [Flavobacteriaceae bacterium]
MKPTLLILAAGMGSRYGGLKQMDGLGPSGETIIDYSIYDAIRAGFGKVVFVIRESFKEEFQKSFEAKLKGKIETAYVCQELSSEIPEGLAVNPEREKPWGTAHAILVTKDIINEPFAVINADDYYGIKAFEQVHDFLTKEINEQNCAIMGYQLSKTLSENGTVSRGVCTVNANNELEKIDERTAIQRNTDGQIVFEENGKEYPLEDTMPVSMNFWGFHPSIFKSIEEKFSAFIKEKGMELKSEFYIPLTVDDLRNENKMKAMIIPTESEWFGVTYQADREPTVAKLLNLVEKGIYPKNLWE